MKFPASSQLAGKSPNAVARDDRAGKNAQKMRLSYPHGAHPRHSAVSADWRCGFASRDDFQIAQRPARRLCLAVARGGS